VANPVISSAIDRLESEISVDADAGVTLGDDVAASVYHHVFRRVEHGSRQRGYRREIVVRTVWLEAETPILTGVARLSTNRRWCHDVAPHDVSARS